MVYKIKWSNLYLICLFVWAIVYCLSNETSFGGTYQWIYKTNSMVWLTIRLLLFCEIFFCYKDKKDFATAILIILIAVMVELCSHSDFLVPFFWFLAAGKNIKTNKAIKTLWFAELTVVSMVVVLGYTGIIENVSSIRSYNADIRYGYGFLHPNTLASKILQLCAMKVYLDKNRISVFHIVKIVLVSILTFLILNSRTAVFLMLALAVFASFYYLRIHKNNVLGKISKRIIMILRFTGVLLFITSCFFAIYYNDRFSDYSSGNTLFSRFAQIYLYFNYYDLKIFGQELYVHSSNVVNEVPVAHMYTLDNGYISLLLGQGIAATVLFIILYIRTVRFEKRTNNLIGISILIIYAVYGFAETSFIRFSLNFSMLLMMEAFWIIKAKSNRKLAMFYANKSMMLYKLRKTEAIAKKSS